MQFQKVMRGCLWAYATGVLICLLWSLGDGLLSEPVIKGLFVSVLIIAFGAVFASVFSIFAIVLWFVLAKWNVNVAWWVAPGVNAGITLCLGLLQTELFVLVPFGALTGAVFWYGAFGKVARVRMARENLL